MEWKPTTVLSVERLFMYKPNAVENNCMLRFYIYVYFYNKVFKIKHELYSLKVSPQPPHEKFWICTWLDTEQPLTMKN
jgi:hypothetical protein